MNWLSSKFRSILRYPSRRRRTSRAGRMASAEVGVSGGSSADSVNYNVEANGNPSMAAISGGTVFNANKLVDRLLDYVRNNYAQQIDPYTIDDNFTFNYGNYASFVITSGVANGATNFERIGNTLLIKSHRDLRLTLCAHILFTDLLVDLKFTAYLTKISVRDKDLRIFLEKLVIYVELTFDLNRRKSTHISNLRIVTIDGLEAKTRGLIFPLNKSFDSIIRKLMHSWTNSLDHQSEHLRLVCNQLCDQYVDDSLFKHVSISEFFEMFS